MVYSLFHKNGSIILCAKNSDVFESCIKAAVRAGLPGLAAAVETLWKSGLGLGPGDPQMKTYGSHFLRVHTVFREKEI